MEETGTTNPKYVCTSHHEFNGTRSCAHAWKIISFVPIHLFTKQIVAISSLCQESLAQSSLWSFSPVLLMRLINCLKNILHACCFSCFFHFHSTHFVLRLAGACSSFSNLFYAFTCLSNISLISILSAKLVSAFSSWENTWKESWKIITLQVDKPHNLDPWRIICRYTIYIDVSLCSES